MASTRNWNNRILIVDDQEEIHQDFEETLNPSSHSATTEDLAKAFDSVTDIVEFSLPTFELIHARNGDEAIAIVKEAVKADNPIAVAYIDIRMPPGIDGVETTHHIRDIDQEIEVVLMTAYTDRTLDEIICDMQRLNKVLYLRKPYAAEEIQQMAISLVEKWNAERALNEKSQHLEAVLDATGNAIVMFDKAQRLQFANRWYRNLFDLADQELQEKSAGDLWQHMRGYFQEPARFDAVGTSCFADVAKMSDEIFEMNPPSHRTLHQATMPVRDPKDNIIGQIVVYRDISKDIEMSQIRSEVHQLRAELKKASVFENLIGTSAAMQEIYALMEQAVGSNITVLIEGESGTGKELVARAIHFNSAQKDGPFVAVNCAAIPETLIESELFGHERGAFTGAIGRRIGKFEQAKDGTIFLDEIGEMPPALQTKLLRVLQEKEIQRVGGMAAISINARVVAATNKDLKASIEAGEFREDLFYRISVFPIHIPPLRVRHEDIPLLVSHFIEKHAKVEAGTTARIVPEALELLMCYHWPGNVRELENVVERALLLGTSDVLTPSQLPEHIRLLVTTENKSKSQGEILPFDEVEKQALIDALKATNNNISHAAKALRLGRNTIYRKLKKYTLL